MRQTYLPLAEDAAWRAEAPPCLDRYDEIELDAETTGLDWARGDRPVGWAVGAGGRTWYLPFAHRGGGNLDEAVVKRWAERELRGKRIRNHTIKFDLHMARVWGVDLREQDNTFHDVSHSEALLDDNERRFNLNRLAEKRLGLGKLDAGPKEGIGDQHASAVATYAERDVALVRQLADHYAPLLAAEDLGRVAKLEDDVVPAVVEIEANGMPLDLELLERWNRESQVIVERLAFELYRLAGFRLNPDSPVDLSRLWKHCGVPITRLTEQGKPSFTADVVQEAAARHPAIQLAWRIGKLNDLRSKYLIKYSKEHVGGVLYASLNQLASDDGGTVSGRFSCVRPNLQQVQGADKHRRLYGWLTEYGDDFLIKRLFCAPAGRRVVAADQEQVEFRLAAHYARDERLLEAYRRDPRSDFHQTVVDMVRPFRPNITRTEAKVSSFLQLYGGGPQKLSEALNVDISEAYQLADQYAAAFPKMKEFLRRAEDAARTRGFVRTLLGRRSRFPLQERTYAAANRVIQPCAADIFKLTVKALYDQRRELDLTLRMLVHDEVVGDIASVDTVRLEELLNEQRLPLSVPILWSVGTGETWAEAK